MSTVISECQDGYYKEGAQCVQCSSNCAANTKCNKDTGKCDGKHGFVCIMGRKSAMTERDSDDEVFSIGASPRRLLIQYFHEMYMNPVKL